MSVTRRIYVYSAAYIAFLVTATGAVLLLDGVMELVAGDVLQGSVAEVVGIGAAMVIVGLPVWAFHNQYAQIRSARDLAEADSVLRKVYIYAALAVSGLMAVFAAQTALKAVLTNAKFSEAHLADFLVPAGFWVFYWMQERREGQPTEAGRTVNRWYLYGTSLVFLTSVAAGLLTTLNYLATLAYDAILPSSDVVHVSGDPGQLLGDSAAWVIVGSAAWVAQWSRVWTRDSDSVLRFVYLYIFTFVGGALLAFWGGANILNLLLEGILGANGAGLTTAHFRGITSPMVQLVLGFGLLAYHWTVLKKDAELHGGDIPTTLRSTFLYTMSAIGLGTLVPGAVLLLGAILGWFVDANAEVLMSGDRGTEILVPALTMLLIGTPMWFLFWARIQKTARAVTWEPGGLIRRIYVYGILAVLGLAALSALIGVVAVTLTEILQGQGLGELPSGIRWFLAALIPIAAMVVYHVLLLRDDVRLAADSQPPRSGEEAPEEPSMRIALAAPSPIAESIATRLREATGGTVTILRVIETGQALITVDNETMADLVAQLTDSEVEDVLIIVDERGVRLLPLMESPSIS